MNTSRVLNGRYELGGLLGRGGMADVYQGRDVRLGRTIAVKLLRADLARDPQFQARFRREAQAVAGLNHPSIVAVYDTGEQSTNESPDGARVPFIVMEYISGRTLRDLIRAKELTIDQAIEYTLGVLSALEYSHRAGIVHRDIKPANVMVTQDGKAVKVMDFGIARAIADSSATMTQTQAVIGTAQYLSPEQARGETVDARSDLYSAACLFYEMLTGRPPFVGDSPVSVAYQHVRETAEAPSYFNGQVSRALDSVVIRALQKNRGDRFQDAAAFRRALRAAKSGVQLSPLPASEAPTDPDGIAPTQEPLAKAGLSHAPLDATVVSAEGPDAEPVTRAMAKVLAGGALTTGHTMEEDPDSHPLGLPPERERDAASHKRRRTWIVTLFIFLALVLAGGGVLGYNLLTAKPPAKPQVVIPSVKLLNETDALAKLYNAGLKPSIDRRYDDTIPNGQAVGTDPATGNSVDTNSSIQLIISKGPSTVTIPASLVKMTESSARDAIRGLGLTAGATKLVNDGTISQGQVVTTDPAPGQVVSAGSSVDLMVSTGKVTMPALIGLTKDDAAQAIKDASPTLQVNFVEKDNAVVDPGKVTSQSTDAGADVDQFSTVTVEIAKAPAPASPPATDCPSSGSSTASPGACTTPTTKSTPSGGGKDRG